MSFLFDLVSGASSQNNTQDATVKTLHNVQAELIKVTIVAQDRLAQIQELEERLRQVEAEKLALQAQLRQRDEQESKLAQYAQQLDKELSIPLPSELPES